MVYEMVCIYSRTSARTSLILPLVGAGRRTALAAISGCRPAPRTEKRSSGSVRLD